MQSASVDHWCVSRPRVKLRMWTCLYNRMRQGRYEELRSRSIKVQGRAGIFRNELLEQVHSVSTSPIIRSTPGSPRSCQQLDRAIEQTEALDRQTAAHQDRPDAGPTHTAASTNTATSALNKPTNSKTHRWDGFPWSGKSNVLKN